MSIAIDIDTVTAVLLADGWHDVLNFSFTIDCYEFVSNAVDSDDPFLCDVFSKGEAGATWLSADDRRMSCPLRSVLAIQTFSGTLEKPPKKTLKKGHLARS